MSSDGAIQKISEARRILAQAKTAFDFKLGHDISAASLKLMRSRHEFNVDARNEMAELVIRFEAGLGRLLSELPRSRGRKPKNGNSSTRLTNLSQAIKELCVSRQQANNWQKIGGISDAKLDSYFQSVISTRDELTSFGAIAFLG